MSSAGGKIAIQLLKYFSDLNLNCPGCHYQLSQSDLSNTKIIKDGGILRCPRCDQKFRRKNSKIPKPQETPKLNSSPNVQVSISRTELKCIVSNPVEDYRNLFIIALGILIVEALVTIFLKSSFTSNEIIVFLLLPVGFGLFGLYSRFQKVHLEMRPEGMKLTHSIPIVSFGLDSVHRNDFVFFDIDEDYSKNQQSGLRNFTYFLTVRKFDGTERKLFQTPTLHDALFLKQLLNDFYLKPELIQPNI